MPQVEFKSPDGDSTVLQGEDGFSLMEVAVQNGVDGIDADCGGALTCATCHVYVDPEWLDRLPPIETGEADMLEFAVEPRGNSRLSCQIRLSAALDGLIVEIPVSQH
ncbi:2Fe-2S iron-sulfur cluster-binding protein [Sphingomonas naphthae]|uniref:2Fe-2S iron-sulfur cluster-binding protein n=1 Tax=Sphingomonas naphthae TaxID=1813468 RepID=A0ABY7TG98_9SPHN|nr:2Fe-2S iron-sulfur cluster-binding protein [Sphingomonas naphthae]WCT72169.1 2Fe-2S iron-sulfur cluster-binding protein [Sphingomonas naphthae]